MITMSLFTGALLGGPDDGNFVTSTCEKIPAKATIELWLDGNTPSKAVNQAIVTGSYIWNENTHLFDWNLETAEYYTRKPDLT